MNDQYLHGLIGKSMDSGFPNFLDLSGYEILYDWEGQNHPLLISEGVYEVVSVTGSGSLSFCRMFGLSNTAPELNIILEIDGVDYEFEGSSPLSNSSGNLIMQPIHFEEYIKIKAHNTSAVSKIPVCDYTIIRKIAEPNPENQTILSSGVRKHGFVETGSTSFADVVNVDGSGYLLDALFTGYYGSASRYVNALVVIDGVTILPNTRNLISPSGGSFKQHNFKGPVRFENSLRVAVKPSNVGITAQSHAWYTLD